MLDQETGLRAWLATGDEQFLEPYATGKENTDAGSRPQLLEEVEGHSELAKSVVTMLLARQSWQEWASDAAGRTYTATERDRRDVDGVPGQGQGALRQLPDRAGDVSGNAIRPRSARTLSRSRTAALLVVLLSYLVLLGDHRTCSAIRRRRRLQRTVVAPIADLHDTVEPAPRRRPVRAGRAVLGRGARRGRRRPRRVWRPDLSQARLEATARERRLAKLAYRFETVVRVGREIAGSLSVRYVSASVATAAAELLNASTVLWLRGEGQAFEVVARSVDAARTRPPHHRSGRAPRAWCLGRPQRPRW